MLRIAGFVAALVAAASVSVAPAHAEGYSEFCFDGASNDVPILVTPYTLGIEYNADATGTWVGICYATAPLGHSGAQATGGFVKVLIHPNGAGELQCFTDQNSITQVVCGGDVVVAPTTGGILVRFDVVQPVPVGDTGVEVAPFITISPGISVDPSYPCITVAGVLLLPAICGTPIIP